MVQMLHRRKSTAGKSLVATNNGECKSNQTSPAQIKKHGSANGPFELRNLLRKKSSKEKDKLLVGGVSNIQAEKDHKFTIDYVKINTAKFKPKLVTKGTKNEKLFDAVSENDLQSTRKLIFNEDIDINEVSLDGNTVLHIASALGNLDCVNMLLECGAKVEIKDAFNKTPLEYAVLYGNYECASALIEYGADISTIKDGIS